MGILFPLHGMMKNKEAFTWICRQLAKNVWKMDANKDCAALVLNWFKAACTIEPKARATAGLTLQPRSCQGMGRHCGGPWHIWEQCYHAPNHHHSKSNAKYDFIDRPPPPAAVTPNQHGGINGTSHVTVQYHHAGMYWTLTDQAKLPRRCRRWKCVSC